MMDWDNVKYKDAAKYIRQNPADSLFANVEGKPVELFFHKPLNGVYRRIWKQKEFCKPTSSDKQCQKWSDIPF